MARNSKIQIDGLSKEVMSILNKYADDIADLVDDASEESAKQCVKKVKANAKSSFKGKGDYAKSWTKKQTQFGRGNARWTIYSKKPGLPHLLEYGHQNVLFGGFTSGRKHIEPAEQEANKEFQRNVEEGIKRC